MDNTSDPAPVRVRVIIRDQNGTATTNKIVDHANAADRQWMGKAAFWAFRNAHSMETIPLPTTFDGGRLS